MIQVARFLTMHRLRVLLLIAFCLGTNIALDARQADWGRSAYRIQLHLAAEVPAEAQSNLAANLATYLEQRIDATLYPSWTVEISQPKGPFRHQLLTHLAELTKAKLTEESSPVFDKHMYLVIASTPEGYALKCRELDHATQMLGPMLSRNVQQRRLLGEHCFQLLCKTFAPLAKVRRTEDDPLHVTLHFKGVDLPQQANQSLFVRSGDVYQPLRIRMTRTGEVRPGGINIIPWTYLEYEGRQDESKSNRWRVHSATKHPFGVRRRGRVEYLAIAVRQPPATTRVRFYARHNKQQSLMGYEVFRREPDAEKSQLIGLTDNRGSVEVLPGKANITTLFLRSGNELLAKVPVVPGAKKNLEIPIADDTARLNAQATLTSLREQLIDLVARRNILISRTQGQIEESSFDEARKLLGKLDELPGRAQFAQLISSAQNNRRNHSDEPRIQARIEKMFANTRKLLGRFLDSRPVSDLKAKLRSAQNNANQSS
ncbi:MAG: hypothetical protein GXP26_11415 [Planctomycetes bacterium]|nr:hypothetical protein [Planctomycetota bacterium]